MMNEWYLLKKSREMRRALSARLRGMRDASLLRIPKGGACPPLLKSYNKWLFFILAISFVSFSGCGKSALPSAVLEEFKGKVQVRTDPKALFEDAKPRLSLTVGGAIRTKDDGLAKIKYLDGNLLEIRANSYFEIGEMPKVGKQESGEILYQITPVKIKTSIETPQGMTGVLGTKFVQVVTSSTVVLSLIEGKLEFKTLSGEASELEAGNQMTISDGKISKPIKMDPFFKNRLIDPGLVIPGFNQR